MEQVDQSIAGYLKFHLITIGFNNGLFDALQEKLSCSELAKATKCDERYLREWCQGTFVFIYNMSYIFQKNGQSA